MNKIWDVGGAEELLLGGRMDTARTGASVTEEQIVKAENFSTYFDSSTLCFGGDIRREPGLRSRNSPSAVTGGRAAQPETKG